jgi:hypothetical protein
VYFKKGLTLLHYRRNAIQLKWFQHGVRRPVNAVHVGIQSIQYYLTAELPMTWTSVTTICRSLSEIMASVSESRMLGALPLHRPRPHDGALTDMCYLRFLHGISISMEADVLNVQVPKYTCHVPCTQPVLLRYRSPHVPCAALIS